MASKKSPALFGLRILVVEDNYMVAQLLGDILEDWGCVVIGPFPNAQSGVKAIENARLDGAVLDANLGGGMTSAPVAAALLAASVPYLVATGYGVLVLADEVLDRAPRIAKPINDAELEATAIAAFTHPDSAVPRSPVQLPTNEI
jgi:DNA-binding response OmpR family regulator